MRFWAFFPLMLCVAQLGCWKSLEWRNAKGCWKNIAPPPAKNKPIFFHTKDWEKGSNRTKTFNHICLFVSECHEKHLQPPSPQIVTAAGRSSGGTLTCIPVSQCWVCPSHHGWWMNLDFLHSLVVWSGSVPHSYVAYGQNPASHIPYDNQTVLHPHRACW